MSEALLQQANEQLQVAMAEKQSLSETINNVLNAQMTGRTQIILLEGVIAKKDAEIESLKEQLANAASVSV